MKSTVLMMVLASGFGCGNVQTTGGGNGDDPGADAGIGSGNGEIDGSVTPPPDAPPLDPGVLGFVPTPIHDERGDTIDFTTGEPVHTHSGATVQLGATGCPAVYKYAYLLDANPAFGRQVTQNPLAWQIQTPATATLDQAQSAYRVVAESGQVLIAWTALPATDATNHTTVTLNRAALPALDQAGKLHLDVRVRDTAGVEQVVHACWDHHPLAAPVAIEAPRKATTANALYAMTLLANSPISTLMSGLATTTPDVVEQRIVQQTAEPVEISVNLGAVSGTYTSTVVDDFIPTGAGDTGDCEVVSCDTSPVPDPADMVRSGALTGGAWTYRLIDEVSGHTVNNCGGAAGARCTLPPRAAGEAPHPYRMVASLGQVQGPMPTSEVYELFRGGMTFTGRMVLFSSITRCTFVKSRPVNGTIVSVCMASSIYEEMHALDRTTVNLGAISVSVSSAIPNQALAPVPYYGASTTLPPSSWDAGDDDVPGPM